MKRNIIIAALVALVVGGAGGFFAGMKIEQKKARTAIGNFQNMTPEQRQQMGGQFRGRNGAGGGQAGNVRIMNGANFATGEIISKDDKSITVKLPDGGSKIVYLSDTTQVAKSASGSKDDLVIGSTVTANGKTGDDGSLTADNIQIRPSLGTPIKNN